MFGKHTLGKSLTMAARAAAALSFIGASSAYAAAVSMGDATVNEADPVENTFARIPVTLDAPSGTDVTITVKSFHGTGGSIAGDDFLPSNRTLVIPAGQTEILYNVRIVNDDIAEALETFNPKILTVSVGHTIADNTGLATIHDDDIPAGSITGSLGAAAGGGTISESGSGVDPYDLSTWFTSQVSNSESLITAGNSSIDAQGFPNQYSSAIKAKSFSKPSMWPPASASDATSLPVPAYIKNSGWVGAFKPLIPRSEQWTNGWTIRINGNSDVWRFFGGEPDSALEFATAPVADDSCPASTVLQPQSFAERFGSLVNDEEGLFAGVSGDYDICRLGVRYTGNVTLTNDNVYEIAAGFPGTKVGDGDFDRGTVPVPGNHTMVVEPGTLVFGEPQEALVITRGSRLIAKGTATAPIVMTSAQQLSQRFDANVATPVDSGRGEWAGLMLMGNARDNQCADFNTCDVAAEGNVGFYGGPDDDDSSGSLRYLVVRHGGNDIDGQGNELNGISFAGVGRSTTVQYIQVHRNFDDGVEFFGGSVFVANAVLTGHLDDHFDCDNGWTGGAQYVLIIPEGDEGNRGIECDGNFALEPITFPLLSNFTILAPSSRTPGNVTNSEGQAIIFREGMRVQMWNSILTGDWHKGALDVDNADTFNRASEDSGAPPANPGAHFFIKQSIIDAKDFNWVEDSTP